MRSLLLALIAVEDAQWNGNLESDAVVNARAFILAAEGGIGRGVSIGQLHIGVAHCDRLEGGAVVGARGDSLLLHLVESHRNRRRVERPRNVEISGGFFDAHQQLQIVAGLNKVELRAVKIGLELSELEIDALKVSLATSPALRRAWLKLTL